MHGVQCSAVRTWVAAEAAAPAVRSSRRVGRRFHVPPAWRGCTPALGPLPSPVGDSLPSTQLGTRPLTALAPALTVIRPAASVGSCARSRASSRAIASDALAASAGRTLWSGEDGRPVVGEIGKRPLHGDLPASRRPPDPHPSTSPAGRPSATLQGSAASEPRRTIPRISTPQRVVGKSIAQHVPRIGRDARSARADHSRHLGNPLGRGGNEEDHQRHDRGVERIVGKRERHRIALMKPRLPRRDSRAGKGELLCGRVDPLDRDGRAPLDEPFGKGTVAATDVQPSQARFWREPVEKDLTGQPAPLPHVSFVAGSVIEADLLVCHPVSFWRVRWNEGSGVGPRVTSGDASLRRLERIARPHFAPREGRQSWAISFVDRA